MDKVNGYTCSCPQGWTRSRCESDIGLCNIGMVTAISPEANYNSNLDGYSGLGENPWTSTEYRSSDLRTAEGSLLPTSQSGPCLNNAKCIDLPNGFHCKCPFNLNGEDCRKTINIDYDLHINDDSKSSSASLSVPFELNVKYEM